MAKKLALNLKEPPADYLKMAKPIADAVRLAKPHARVRVMHTGQKLEPMVLNPMVVIDRHRQSHLLQPGQSVEIEMVNDEIEHLREFRRPGRMISKLVQLGELYIHKMVEAPLHPLLIEEV